MSVTRKLTDLTMADPLGRSPEDDPWHDFRQIEQLDLSLEFRFTHSLGKVSRFYLELEQQRLMGTRCGRCDTVWMPPRPVCGNDGCVTKWVEVSQHGVLVAATVSAHDMNAEDQKPTVLGYAALDGVTTLLFQRIRNFQNTDDLVAGLPLRVVWSTSAVSHPMESFWFEPRDTAATD